MDQQSLAIVTLQTEQCQTEVEYQGVSSAGFNRDIDSERHRSGRPLVTSRVDDHSILNTALRKRMMNATQLQA